jgi:hypothetical protein
MNVEILDHIDRGEPVFAVVLFPPMITCPVAAALGKALNQPWKVSVLPRKT